MHWYSHRRSHSWGTAKHPNASFSRTLNQNLDDASKCWPPICLIRFLPAEPTPDASLYFLPSYSYGNMDLLNFFLIITSVCAFIYTIQLVYLDRIRLRSGIIAETTSKRRAQLLRAGPVVCSLLATIALVLVPLIGSSRFKACLQENSEINPDVGGIGVLLGLFLPCLVILVVLFLGHFTVHTSGAKELCMAQCASEL